MAMSPDIFADSLTYYLTTGSPITRPTAWTVSLHTAAPGSDGTANEVGDSGYARLSVTFTLDVSDPDAPFVSNSALLAFGAAVAAYTVTHVVVWGDTTPVVIEALRTEKVINIGEQAQFAIGELVVGGL